MHVAFYDGVPIAGIVRDYVDTQLGGGGPMVYSGPGDAHNCARALAWSLFGGTRLETQVGPPALKAESDVPQAGWTDHGAWRSHVRETAPERSADGGQGKVPD